MLSPDFWGLGYCTEALRWFLKQLFENQPQRSALVAGVHDGNERSLRVLLKCGFVGADSLESAMGQPGRTGNSKSGDIIATVPSIAPESCPGFSWLRFERPLIVD